MARILLKNITKIFGGNVTAVNNATLEVVDQEFMVIVGPSGCGKTTILRIIAGLEEPTSGTITIGDKIVNDISPKDRDVAMVFQNYALYPHMTVFQNIAFALKLRKYPKKEIIERVENVAKMLGIEHLLYRKPKALSGGQRQRVAVGRAIARKPSAFLFDEPLSNLDAKLRVTTRTELKALHHKLRTTSIYVTHDQSEAMTLGDRICVLHNGVVQQVALPLEVYDRPSNRFVAGFFGTLPMNFLNGAIRYVDDNVYFATNKSMICLPSRMKTRLSTYQDKQAVLGIRPEHISLRPFTGQTQNNITAIARAVEPLGDRTDVYLESSFHDGLIATVGSHADFNVGQQITVYIDSEKAHIFEPDPIGKNISLADR